MMTGVSLPQQLLWNASHQQINKQVCLQCCSHMIKEPKQDAWGSLASHAYITVSKRVEMLYEESDLMASSFAIEE